MINYKTKEEIELIKEGGRKLREVVKELTTEIKAGVKTSQIDNKAEELIRELGGESSFKRVPNYKWSTCLCINEQIVHTPPSDRVLKEGDILTIDIGMFYKGFHTDSADTIAIGKVNKRIEIFLQSGKKTLQLAIKEMTLGNRIGQISQTIEKSIEKAGYSIVEELTGHGVGIDLHEDPQIPGFLDKPIEKTLSIGSGLVVAIEVIYAMGNGAMEYEKPEGWSIRTRDRSISACFEHTVAVTDNGSIILT